jgi:hypothetical protein
MPASKGGIFGWRMIQSVHQNQSFHQNVLKGNERPQENSFCSMAVGISFDGDGTNSSSKFRGQYLVSGMAKLVQFALFNLDKPQAVPTTCGRDIPDSPQAIIHQMVKVIGKKRVIFIRSITEHLMFRA